MTATRNTLPVITVPLHAGTICAERNPTTNAVCLRAIGHHGRCAYYWRHVIPGRLRQVWAYGTCQVCGQGVSSSEGPVCRKCGHSG